MVTKVPLTRKPITWKRTITTAVDTKKWLVTVAVEAMRLSLMAKQARRRGETCALARIGLAPIWLEVRVDKFTVIICQTRTVHLSHERSLTRNCT